MHGFVYVLVSPNSQFVKIGLTTSAPMFRIRDINSSENYGGLGPWELFDFREVLDCQTVERLLHSKFGLQRARAHTSANELFQISPAEARRGLEELEPSLLARQEQVDQLFHDADLMLYLQRLFGFTGLPNWLDSQGAWTFTLFPGTYPRRYFTINIGPHEVAYSNLKKRGTPAPIHFVIVDRLIYDFSDTCAWVRNKSGEIADNEYSLALERGTSIRFPGSFPEAEMFYALPGVRRAMIAYWTEALIRLRERGVLSSYARYHNYNAVAKLVDVVRQRRGYSGARTVPG